MMFGIRTSKLFSQVYCMLVLKETQKLYSCSCEGKRKDLSMSLVQFCHVFNKKLHSLNHLSVIKENNIIRKED